MKIYFSIEIKTILTHWSKWKLKQGRFTNIELKLNLLKYRGSNGR
jgi:hypothetical protein